MTDKLLIEALEREKFNAWLKGANYSPTGDEPGYRNDPAIRYPDQEETAWLGWMACARHRSQQEAAQEPFGWGWVEGNIKQFTASREMAQALTATELRDPMPLYTRATAPSESEAPEGTASMTHEAISEALHKGAPLNHGQRAALIKLVSDDKRHQNDYDAGIKDAARYRWLREKERGVPAPAVYGPFTSLPLHGDELDVAIDAALSASGQNGEPT